MSKQTELMELDKCIFSRLWYTATILHQREIVDRCRHHRDIKKLKNLIQTRAEEGPSDQKWIAYNLSRMIECDDETRECVAREEFLCALRALESAMTPAANEELLRLFEAIRTTEQKTEVPISPLSQETLECLEKNLLDHPALIHWIISQLLSSWEPTSFPQTDSDLQNVYFNTIKKLLDQCPRGSTEENENAVSFGFRNMKQNFDTDSLAVLLSILSKLELKEGEMPDWVFPALLETTNSEDIELALYSRKDPRFFKAWHEFLDDIYSRSHKADNMETARKISRIMFTVNEDSSLSLNVDEIFKRTLTRKSHWLMDILDLCYVFLINEHHREVEKILEIPMLQNLWLPLLFTLLNDCTSTRRFSNSEKTGNSASTCQALRCILEKSEISSWSDPVLKRLRATLKSHLKVLDWITSNEETSKNPSKNANSQNFSVKNAMALLPRHSVLAVLKMTINIHEKPYEDIQELLSDDENSKSTFQAYCAILEALKGLLMCELYNEKYEKVAEHFDEMEKLLGSLFPLDLRLEVIENIFSMLFLRHENFVATDSSSEVSDDDDTTIASGEKEQKSNVVHGKIGFLCNKYAIREILHRLKRSSMTVELECEELKNDRALSAEKIDSMEKRIVQLSKAIADGIWRLELLTSLEFVERHGMPDVDLQICSISRNQRASLDDGRPGYSTSSRNNMNFYNPRESSSDESELFKSDVDGSSETGSPSNATSNSTRRKKRLKKILAAKETPVGSAKYSKIRENTVECMLASKESLVVQCLWKGDYDRALQVIEMFGLKNSHLDGEILFSRAMRNFRKDMRAQWAKNESVDQPDRPSEQSTLENIRKAVQDGFQTCRTTSQVETFLAAQESSVRLMNSDPRIVKEILTMSSLDLALTMCETRADFVNLAEMTMKYLKSCKKLANSRYEIFFASLYESILESKDSNLSIKKLLCDAGTPFSAKERRDKSEYWSRLQKKLDLLRQSSNKEDDPEENFINENTSAIDQSFQEIIALCDNGELYLPRIYAHLKLLRTLESEECETLEDNTRLLEKSLDTYMGDQIFRLNVELEVVESIASRLGVNLVHSILVNCCPKLSCREEESREKDVKSWETRILNEFPEGNENFASKNSSESNECVREILEELMSSIREKIPAGDPLSLRKARELSENEEIREILKKTQLLASLELSNLSFGHQTLAFFINVWNLLMIHTLLDVWSKNPPTQNNLRHEISLATIGYEIGDLGTVSLSALRSKLLGHSILWGSHYFSHNEEINEPAWQDLDVPHDPRLIFAMINEYEKSPIIRIYGLTNLDVELQSAMSDYTNFYGKAEPTNLLSSDEKVDFELWMLYEDMLAKKANNSSSSKNSSDEEHVKEPSEFIETVSINVEKKIPYSYNLPFVYENSQDCGSENEKTISKTLEDVTWQTRIVKPSLLQYLEGHCWLISYLVQRIHEESPTIHDSNCENLGRTAALENLLKSSWANSLKCLCGNNEIVAALRKIDSTEVLWNGLEEIFSSGDLKKCLEIVDAIPDSMKFRDIEIKRFRDTILVQLALIDDQKIYETMKYVYQIDDVQILAQTILSKANELPVKVCQESIQHILSHVKKDKLPAHCKTRLNEILCRVTVFQKMLPFCSIKRKKSDETEEEDDNWNCDVYRAEKSSPVRIVKTLIDAAQFELCLEWLEYQAVLYEIHPLVTQDLLLGLLANENECFKPAVKLLQALPTKKSINLCIGAIGKLESIDSLHFVVNYLLENSPSSENAKYRRALLGVNILEKLDVPERHSYMNLIEQPLLILEQLLMNCRLDSLQKIVLAVREKPECFGPYSDAFDETVRFYAKKSLDFRVAFQADTGEKIKDSSTSSGRSSSGDFVMPANIPSKEEWVPNDKASECSCCKVVIFSMFNRRHHCRRCGRVVCAACSPQRMSLPNYANSVPVRVCNDCKRQTIVQMQTAPSMPSSSDTFECWHLNVDETHNKTLRDEFSFENAPNLSLCLAILNLHSDHEAYSNFLLDRCDEMKSLLRPDSNGRVNPEIDHALIIKMIKSLLVAAKVKYAELGLNTGLTHCDRFLSQVDLIATLVNSDCSSLIPKAGNDDRLDDHTLRRLRDLLIEREQWIIALDVSTKIGLDTQGVWAAWGTACLKVGYYKRARDKFVYCLDKVLREESDDWVMLSYPGESSIADKEKKIESWSPSDNSRRRRTTSTRSQEGLKSRPSKDPPLLTEILQILEKSTPNDVYCTQNSKSMGSSGAQEILNTLSSLKSIAQGQCTISSPTRTKNIRYQESLYYLLMYGSYNSILEFFIKHQEYDKCLGYILENDVEPELFMNSVFLRCLRNGTVVALCEAMRAKDSSLVSFKKYFMYTCHYLERKQLLNTLLQLQLFMKDYVRASMTCIRFYVAEATSYEDLYSRAYFLVDAQKHLESELQLESFGKKRRKSFSSNASGQNNLTLEMDPIGIDRHMNTISRQMEIAKFLGSREQERPCVSKFMENLSSMDCEGSSSRDVPTLFGNQQEKTHLAVLAILCGKDVEEGFGIAFRIMQDYNLRPQKIYSLVGHMLALEQRISSIEQLIKCCRSSGAPNSNVVSDRVLAHCVKLLLDPSRVDYNPSPKDQIDTLIRIITDVELKIESYIESRQLKAAYLLAVKHSRAQDIRKILKEADRLGQSAIKSICTKWLQQTQRSRSVEQN